MTNNETCNGADHEVVRSQKNTVIETVSHLSKHDKRIQFCFDNFLPHKPWTSRPRRSAYNPFCDPSWFPFEVFERYTSPRVPEIPSADLRPLMKVLPLCPATSILHQGRLENRKAMENQTQNSHKNLGECGWNGLMDPHNLKPWDYEGWTRCHRFTLLLLQRMVAWMDSALGMAGRILLRESFNSMSRSNSLLIMR